MNCSSCGHENPDRAKFCLECGGAMGLPCQSCGTELPADARFCLECGSPTAAAAVAARGPLAYTPKHLVEKILHSKSALEGERKQVTVLFADVQGSMELQEEIDPEEWHRTMDGFFQILADGVHRFEGRINQYTGDGIMALFGAPIAHEDHAQRACYAALHLRDELRAYSEELKRTRGFNLSVRQGLNSGEVVVGKIGDDLRMDYTAQGHAVGLAHRMEELASAESAYLTHHTARLVEGYFELRDLGEFELKGSRDPLPVHVLEGLGQLRTRLDVSRARGFTRFVGRADEMATVQAALSRAIEGNGQVVGVVGEPGVGKSRLCLEFVERCRAKNIPVTDGHCPAHGKTIPFLPILEMLRNFFGIEVETDSDHEARRKIAGELTLLRGDFQDLVPLVLDFLGVPDPEQPAPNLGAEGRQQQLFAFVRRLIQARSEREPSVLLIDDLHWIDPGSDEFVSQAVEAVGGTRTLLLLNFRPEYHAAWMQKSNYHQLPLAPLGPEAIRDLLDDLLGNDPSIADLAGAIHQRAAGNPFFTEEVVQSLIEAGNLEGTKGSYRLVTPIETLQVPDTVHSVLAARIDRLAEREKHVLQTAAVIGREFHGPILEVVSELPTEELAAALAALRDAEFVHERALYPVAEYLFKHPLTHAVALDSQLQDRRQTLHAAVARAIESAEPDKLDERAALLAHHWEEAGQARQAVRWHARAGEWAGTTDAAESRRHWERVRELVRELPDTPETAELGLDACIRLLNLAWRLDTSGAGALRDEGLAFTERTGDLASRAILLSLYGRTLVATGEMRERLEYAREATRVAEQTDDAKAQASAFVSLIDSGCFHGDFPGALASADEALERFPNDPHFATEIFGVGTYAIFSLLRGWSLYQLGRLQDAYAELERTLEIGREGGHIEASAWGHIFLSAVGYWRGDARGALEEAQRVVEYSEKLGDPPYLRVWAHRALTGAHLAAGRFEDAAESARTWLAIHRERVELSNEAEAWVGLAEALLGAGDWREARRTAEEAVASSRRLLRRFVEAQAHWIQALVLLRSEGADARSAIEAALAEAESLVEASGGRVLEPHLREARAELAALLDDASTQMKLLREAHQLFTEMGSADHAERVARELPDAR